MDDVFGYGDDSNSGWEGLCCPPLDDFAFSFDDDTCYNLDGILDNPLLEADKEEDSRAANGILDDHTNELVGVDKKAHHCYGNNGKGKQLKLNLNMAEIKAFLEEETEEPVAEQKVKKRRIMDCYDCQSLQQKERPGLNHTNRRLAAVVDSKRKSDLDVRLEAAGHKLQGSHKSTCQPMQPKYMARLDNNKRKADVDVRLEAAGHKLHGSHKSTCQPMQPKYMARLDNNKRKADTDFRLEASRHKLHKSSESACQPMPPEDLMRLDHSNQLVVADNKTHTDYDSRYEATRRKLHVSYEQVREAKQQRKIQVIDFQKAVMQQPRCRAKGKSSLRQRLMAMGTHKSNKKFQPFVY